LFTSIRLSAIQSNGFVISTIDNLRHNLVLTYLDECADLRSASGNF